MSFVGRLRNQEDEREKSRLLLNEASESEKRLRVGRCVCGNREIECVTGNVIGQLSS